MRYDAVGLGLSAVPDELNMSVGFVPIAQAINSVDNEGTLGLLLKIACPLSVPGVHS